MLRSLKRLFLLGFTFEVSEVVENELRFDANESVAETDNDTEAVLPVLFECCCCCLCCLSSSICLFFWASRFFCCFCSLSFRNSKSRCLLASISLLLVDIFGMVKRGAVKICVVFQVKELN